MVANPNQAWGLNPVRNFNGNPYAGAARTYYVQATNATALFVGDPVIKSTGAASTTGIPGIVRATAGTSNKITGVVVGFQPTAAMVGTGGAAYRAASTAAYILVADDPGLLFEIQGNSTAGFTAANVGKNTNLVSGTGSTATGKSGFTASVTQVGTSANNQLRIVEVKQAVDNAIGQYGKVLVALNQSTEVPAATGI